MGRLVSANLLRLELKNRLSYSLSYLRLRRAIQGHHVPVVLYFSEKGTICELCLLVLFMNERSSLMMIHSRAIKIIFMVVLLQAVNNEGTVLFITYVEWIQFQGKQLFCLHSKWLSELKGKVPVE